MNVSYQVEEFSSWVELENKTHPRCIIQGFLDRGYLIGDSITNELIGFRYHVTSIAQSLNTKHPEIWINLGKV